MGLFSFLKANKESSGVTEKEKKSGPGSSTDSALLTPPKNDKFKAYIPNFLYKPPFGYPLNKNVLMLKELARNPYIFSVIRTLKDEASTCKFEIRPKKEYAKGVFDDQFDADIQRVMSWFYNPNGNAESFGEIVGQWIQDLCETDAAVGVKVFNQRGEFSQLFARDGSSFLKNPDIYGYMGNRDDFVQPYGEMNPNLVMPEKIKVYGAHYSRSAAYFQYGWTGNALPVPFGKREVMYIMANPRTDSIYGRSPMEIIQDVLLTLVYGVRYNMDYFLNGNMPDGIVNLVGADEEVAKAFQSRLREKFTHADSLGNNNVRRGHVYPVWGGPEVNFVPFQISSKDMEIIEQQKWFTKLVWSAFGVTPDEMGYTEDSNKAVSQAQVGVHKRKALKPLLAKIEYVVNTQLMPELDPSGKLEFHFEDYDLDEDKKRHELYKLQVDIGMKTAEMVAEEEGIDVERLKAEKEEAQQKQMEMQSSDDDDDDWGFDDKLKHKYIKREGRPGNYTYYYDEEKKDFKDELYEYGFDLKEVENAEDGETHYIKVDNMNDAKRLYKLVSKFYNDKDLFNELNFSRDREISKTQGGKVYLTLNDKDANIKHKYIKREGRPGNYTYYYKDGSTSGGKPKKTVKETSTDKTPMELAEEYDKQILSKDKAIIDKAMTALRTKTDTYHTLTNKETGEFIPSRRKLHKEIFREYKEAAKKASSDKPTVVYMAGYPASGKTYSVKSMYEKVEGSDVLLKDKESGEYFVVLNSDDIKTKLPEYANGAGAAMVHEESADLIDKITEGLQSQKVNIIIDGTMKTPSNARKTKGGFDDLGYKSKLIYIDVKLENTLKRAKARYEKSGRYVPYKFIANIGDKIDKSVSDLRGEFSEFIHIDNNKKEPEVLEHVK